MPFQSITVAFWSKVFHLLRYLSIFKYVYMLIEGKPSDWRGRFVDRWVLFHFFGSFGSVLLLRYTQIHWLHVLIVYYGFSRVLEIVVYQINVLLFDDYRAQLQNRTFSIRGYRRMVINLLNNFGEIIFWFACSYAYFTGDLKYGDTSIVRMIFSSFTILTTFGQSNLEAVTDKGLFILWFQCMAGLVMTLLSLARFIGMLPSVQASSEE